jgi:hypothetical protein
VDLAITAHLVKQLTWQAATAVEPIGCKQWSQKNSSLLQIFIT